MAPAASAKGVLVTDPAPAPLFLIVKVNMGSTRVEWLAPLFAGFPSNSVALAFTESVIVPVVMGVTTMLAKALSPETSLLMLHVTTWFDWAQVP